MMGNYAVVEDGMVANTVVWDGDTDNWSPPDGSVSIEYEDGAFIGVGFSYADGVFTPPPPPPVIPPTPEEILAANTGVRDRFLATATLAIAPLQDAVDIDDATPSETALLKLWKQYRVAVNRIDLTLAAPSWPVAPA